MRNTLLIAAFLAENDIAPYRIVKPGTNAGEVDQAAAGTDSLLGVTPEIKQDTGSHADVVVAGIAEVEYGGNVSAGDLLTADASGKATAAAPATGTNVRTIGIATVDGVAGDIGSVLVNPSQIQGA